MERDETADALQSDLEHREAALGRALSLLRTAWDLSANRWPLIEKLRTHHLLDALEWRDVQDWVIGEPREDDEPNTHYDRVSGLWTHLHWLSTHKRTVQGRWVFNHTRSEYAKTSHWSENMDDDETPQVMEVANPAERAAAGVDETLARWRGFSDDELRELRNGAIERYANIGVSSEQRARAGRLVTELRKVIEAREGETTSYRGPGRYRHHGGDVYEVLGTANGGSADPKVVIMRHSSGSYYYERWGNFEMPFDERPRYEYLGPLEGS